MSTPRPWREISKCVCATDWRECGKGVCPYFSAPRTPAAPAAACVAPLERWTSAGTCSAFSSGMSRMARY